MQGTETVISAVKLGKCRALWGECEQAVQCTVELKYCTDLSLYRSSLAAQCHSAKQGLLSANVQLVIVAEDNLTWDGTTHWSSFSG